MKWHPWGTPFSDLYRSFLTALCSLSAFLCPVPYLGRYRLHQQNSWLLASHQRSYNPAWPGMKLTIHDTDKNLLGRPCMTWVIEAGYSSCLFPHLWFRQLPISSLMTLSLFYFLVFIHLILSDWTLFLSSFSPSLISPLLILKASALLLCPQGNLFWLYPSFHTRFFFCSRWHDYT